MTGVTTRMKSISIFAPRAKSATNNAAPVNSMAVASVTSCLSPMSRKGSIPVLAANAALATRRRGDTMSMSSASPSARLLNLFTADARNKTAKRHRPENAVSPISGDARQQPAARGKPRDRFLAFDRRARAGGRSIAPVADIFRRVGRALPEREYRGARLGDTPSRARRARSDRTSRRRS